ncbi:MAG TPA: hypothetical protein VF773_17685 [Verrucomicrobiae bacterium]
MNRLLAIPVITAIAFFAVTIFGGCATLNEEEELRSALQVPPEKIVTASTAELRARRELLQEMIVQIEREVEMKAGLHMGVTIHDDRSKLSELYREARQIDREILRRTQTADVRAVSEEN